MPYQSRRTETHRDISKKLGKLTDEELSALVASGTLFHTGFGSSVLLDDFYGTKLFVKKVPVTELELLEGNKMSTANIFDLPTNYQYGVGSAGFGVWRELETHIMTTKWVISGQCPNFPMLHHWRVLPGAKPELDTSPEKTEKLDGYVSYWGKSESVRQRMLAIEGSSTHVLLFLEFIPHTLGKWLESELATGGETAQRAVTLAEHGLRTTNHFMNTHGLLHFDAHFGNILTDGELVYFTDFGLALSTEFDLSKAEIDFFASHASYDRCKTILHLFEYIVTSCLGKDACRKPLHELIDSVMELDRDKLPLALETFIRRYASIALTMAEFYHKLRYESKLTAYPAAPLDCLSSSLPLLKPELTLWKKMTAEYSDKERTERWLEENPDKTLALVLR